MRKNKFFTNTFNALLCSTLILLTGTDSSLNAGPVPTLREGDRIFQTELIDENGAAIQLSDSSQSTILTFIFTRCAMIEFCPKMNSQFEALQTQAQAKKELDPRLISITLDPEFDRPERLKDYSEAIDADPSIWSFATGSTETIDRLTKAFRVHRDDSEGVLNHTLCTALITPDGTIKKIWRGNAWQVDEVVKALLTTD